MNETKMVPRTSPRDFFLHLLSIVTLYGAAVSFLVLVFQYLNILLPDAAEIGRFYIENARGMIRWALAMLFVVYPVYIFTMRFLKHEYARVPEKREAKIRKWLTYFTLFLTALIVIGNFVALIYNFLEGEFTLRFLLKVLAMVFVAGSVFGYYFGEIRAEKRGEKVAWLSWFPWVVSAVVLGMLILGALSVGSPAEGRMRKFDERRIQDLQVIQSQIVTYWMNARALPENLTKIENTAGGFVVPKDPETNAEYEYRKTGELIFSLCAEFKTEALSSLAEKPYYGIEENWNHSTGRVCFDRTINPELYPKDIVR